MTKWRRWLPDVGRRGPMDRLIAPGILATVIQPTDVGWQWIRYAWGIDGPGVRCWVVRGKLARSWAWGTWRWDGPRQHPLVHRQDAGFDVVLRDVLAWYRSGAAEVARALRLSGRGGGMAN